MIELERIDFYVLEAPVDTPIRTSFAVMTARPALLLRLEAKGGAWGWGEIWCNHPPSTARARLALGAEVIAPMALAGSYSDPAHLRKTLERKTHILNVQTAEPGPYAQVIAGFDTAIFDLAARKSGQPLHVYLGADQKARVPVYASGINPGEAEMRITAAREQGYNAFKVKVGFGAENDRAVFNVVQQVLGSSEKIMFDANQAWPLDAALEICPDIAALAPHWLEEPMPVDTPIADWVNLAKAYGLPLAGGENMLGDEMFAEAFYGPLSVIQPDVAKWGGISGCFSVGEKIRTAGKMYCPHFLGAAPGLYASAHLLAAVGGDGLLEVDFNANPLRSRLAKAPIEVTDGVMTLPEGAGIGFEPDPAVLKKYLVVEEPVRKS